MSTARKLCRILSRLFVTLNYIFVDVQINCWQRKNIHVCRNFNWTYVFARPFSQFIFKYEKNIREIFILRAFGEKHSREQELSFICIFFSQNTIEQIAVYGDKRDISLIIAIYMTRICTKGLNPSLYSARGINICHDDYTLSRDRKRGTGDRFMNVNPDGSPCALNLTPLACRHPRHPDNPPRTRYCDWVRPTTLVSILERVRNYDINARCHA